MLSAIKQTRSYQAAAPLATVQAETTKPIWTQKNDSIVPSADMKATA
jgi:hypothetical protein